MEIKYLSGEIIVYECCKCGAKFYDTDVTNFNFCPNCRHQKKAFFQDNLRFDGETD